MEKKKIGIIIGIVILLVVIILSFAITPKDKEESTTSMDDAELILNNAKQYSANVKEDEKKEFIQINTTDFIEMYNQSEKKIVLIARPTCQYCQIAEPIIQNIAYKYNLDINYLNTDEFSEEDRGDFIKTDEAFENGFGTPFLIIVGNGKINDKVDGLTDQDHYLEFFKNNGYI